MRSDSAAFPQPLARNGNGEIVAADDYGRGGMDLRTYIATAALQALLSNLTSEQTYNLANQRIGPVYAQAAVAAAEHLIHELSKPQKGQS